MSDKVRWYSKPILEPAIMWTWGGIFVGWLVAMVVSTSFSFFYFTLHGPVEMPGYISLLSTLTGTVIWCYVADLVSKKTRRKVDHEQED